GTDDAPFPAVVRVPAVVRAPAVVGKLGAIGGHRAGGGGCGVAGAAGRAFPLEPGSEPGSMWGSACAGGWLHGDLIWSSRGCAGVAAPGSMATGSPCVAARGWSCGGPPRSSRDKAMISSGGQNGSSTAYPLPVAEPIPHSNGIV